MVAAIEGNWLRRLKNNENMILLTLSSSMALYNANRCESQYNTENKKLRNRTSLEVKKKPPIAEVEVSVVAILSHMFKQLRIQNLPNSC